MVELVNEQMKKRFVEDTEEIFTKWQLMVKTRASKEMEKSVRWFEYNGIPTKAWSVETMSNVPKY